MLDPTIENQPCRFGIRPDIELRCRRFIPDLVTAGSIPDPYHGFSIDLTSLHLSPGTYRIEVEAGEFPVGMGATTIANTFTITIPGSAPTISLRTYYGNYVSAANCGGANVEAVPTTSGSCETFGLIDLNGAPLMDGDQIRLTAQSGHFITAEGGGCADPSCVLNANRTTGGAWETFTIHKPAGGQIYTGDAITLQSSSGYYVCAEGGGGDVVNATRPSAAQWETFTVQLQP